MGFNCLKARLTSSRQFTFYHKVRRNSWYSFYRPWKDERLSRNWSHPVILNVGSSDWESSALTTRPLLHKLNNGSGIELTFLLSSGESLLIKIDSLKDSLNVLFSLHKIEKLLQLLLSCSCNNRWSDIGDGLHATLFPVKGDKPICSLDLIFTWRSV